MALQTRSVWEIRFKALMERMKIRREAIMYTMGNAALLGSVDEKFRAKSKIEVEFIDSMLSFGKELEQQRGARIYLSCDF